MVDAGFEPDVLEEQTGADTGVAEENVVPAGSGYWREAMLMENPW